MIPLEKQSKKAQRKYHSRYRRDWNGVKPTTRVVKSKKIYDRKGITETKYRRIEEARSQEVTTWIGYISQLI